MFSFAIEMVPGTIVAWAASKPYSEPPNKWVICNGTEIKEGPWIGKKTPDLRGAFLIGGPQQLTIDGDDMKLATKNDEGFCFKNNEKCFKNETMTYSFNVTYIMKIPQDGIW